jgi:hypothetical protein
MTEIRTILVSGSIPTVNQLPLGDIAINTVDGKAYIKRVSNTSQSIVELGTGGSSISASFASTASYAFFAVTASFAQNFNPSATASYALNALSSSYAVTASYALNANSASFASTSISASYSVSSSQAVSASYATTSSHAINTVSASFASTASYINPLVQNVSIAGNLVVRGTASVDVLITTYESSSIIYSSGSTKFGDSLDDFHEFTGSLLVTGSSHSIIGPTTINNLTGSLFGTASWAFNAIQADSASYAVSSSLVYVNNQSTTNVDYPLIFKGDTATLDNYRSLAADTSGPYYNPSKNTLGSVSGLIVSASSFSGPLTGSLLGTASYADNAKIFPFTGSAIISGSLTVEGNVTVNSAATIDFNANVFNVNAPTLQVPSFGLPYSPSANVRVVMYDAVSNALFVTASAPSAPVITNLIATGSITASVQIGPAATIPYFFLIQSGSVEMLKINAERVIIFESRTDTPTAVTGGLFYSASGDFFFGM